MFVSTSYNIDIMLHSSPMKKEIKMEVLVYYPLGLATVLGRKMFLGVDNCLEYAWWE